MPVVDRDTLLAMQLACEDVIVSESVGLYMVDVVAATRNAHRRSRSARRRAARSRSSSSRAAAPRSAGATT